MNRSSFAGSALRWSVSGPARRGALIAMTSGVFIMLAYLMLVAQSLSAGQVRDREFGRYGHIAGYGSFTVEPGESAPVEVMERSLREHGVHVALVSVMSNEFYVAGVPGEEANYFETDWRPNPFPRRYADVVGRYPERAGEVLVTGAGDVSVGDRLRLLGTDRSVLVVGTADDLYMTAPKLLGGRGTWDLLTASVAEGYPLARADLLVHWSGATKDEGLSAIRDATREVGSPQSARELSRGYHDVSWIRERSGTWLYHLPVGYFMPAVALPVILVLVTFGLNERTLRRLRTVGSAVGMRPRWLLCPWIVASATWILVGLCFGMALGVAAAHVGRPLLVNVLGRAVDLETSLVLPALFPVVVTTVGGVVATTVAVLREPQARAGRGRRRETTHPRLRATLRIATAGCAAAAIVMLPRATTASVVLWVAALLGAAALGIVPDLFRFGAWLVRTGGWRWSLARRRVASAIGRATVFAVAVGSTLSLSLGFAALVGSLGKGAEATALPQVATGQVLIQDRAGPSFPADSKTIAAIADATGRSPVELRYLYDLVKDRPRSQVTVRGRGVLLVAAPDTASAEQILGAELTDAEERLLAQGGLLTWSPSLLGPTLRGPVPIERADGEKVASLGTIEALPVAPVRAEWQRPVDGVMLISTAEARDLPLTRGAALFSGVGQDAVDRARRVAAEIGVDPQTILTRSRPDPAVPPGIVRAVQLALAAIAVLIAAGVAWADSRSGHDLVRLLVSLGISPVAGRTVVLLQVTFMLAVGILVGVLASIPGIVLPGALLESAAFSVPWRFAIIQIAIVIVVALAAAWFGAPRRTEKGV